MIGKKKRRIPLTCLGMPALLQLQAQGFDVSKELDRRAKGLSISLVLPERQHKYNISAADDRTVDGITFASKLEMSAYKLLKQWKIPFERQPEIELAPEFEFNGKKYRNSRYVGDFLIEPAGKRLVVDTKGVETQMFKFKRKLLLAKGIEVHCVKNISAFANFLVERGCYGK